MHEMSLAEEVIRLVEETARREAATQVRRVVLEIGQLAAVEPAALHFCFAAVCRGGLAEGAVLDIVEVAGGGWCAACQQQVPLAERWAPCPYCAACPVEPTEGTGMRVREIEIV